MNKDFWDVAFGGKNMLRLSLGAYDFRTRKNIGSETYSFGYGEGKRIRVMHTDSIISHWYVIDQFDGTWGDRTAVFGLPRVRVSIEEIIGLSLDPFSHG